MGAFHAGHLALFAAAREENDVVVASLFVNPAQFGPAEDLGRYPRDEERDARLAEEAGVDVLFAPSAEEMYPEGYATWVDVGELGNRLEGEFRPDHFRGVATVCLKLFNIVRPTRAYFGQKDAQQAAVVKQLVRDLNLELEIRVVPTVRDDDGLALSSRNAYLSPEEREAALALPRALATKDLTRARELLKSLDVDYLEEANFNGQRVLAAAVHDRKDTAHRQRRPGRRKHVSTPPKGKLALPELLAMKQRGEKIVMVTAYDAPGARFAEDAGVEIILVGDTAAMVVLGYEGTTVPVTMDEMLFLTRTVARSARHPIVVGDMPFGSFQVSDEKALENAIRFVKEAGADAIKLEGAGPMVSRVKTIVDAGIAVMGHVGLTPQSATKLGGFKTQGKTAEAAAELVEGALALEDAGAFAVVLEAVPAPVAAEITRRLTVPTIGIGAGRDTDGQVLVYHDLLGLTEGHLPRFVKRYASLSREIRDALEHYAEEVRDGTFPGDEHTYAMAEEELELFRSSISPSATSANAQAKEPTMSASKSLSPAPASEPPVRKTSSP